MGAMVVRALRTLYWSRSRTGMEAPPPRIRRPSKNARVTDGGADAHDPHGDVDELYTYAYQNGGSRGSDGCEPEDVVYVLSIDEYIPPPFVPPEADARERVERDST